MLSNKLNFKTAGLMLMMAWATVFTTACNNAEKEKRERDLQDFKTYVKEHRDKAEQYAQNSWDELNSEFEKKKAELDKQVDKMDDKARESYNQAVSEWETFKTEYKARAAEREKIEAMDKLRATLVIDGVRTDYTNLTARDAAKQYEHFVTTVKANKDTYTRDQWTAINVNYQALNGRKRELEKDIPAADLKKIIKLQLEYTAIKAVNRPFAEN